MDLNKINLLYYESDQALENNDIERAVYLLDEILSENPKHSQAHNSLGWINRFKFSDVEKAEYHYKLAIQFNPSNGDPLINYIFLLRDQNRLSELYEYLQKAENTDQVNKKTLFDEFGTYYELKQDYKKAIENYKKAIAYAYGDDIDSLKSHIKRCRNKMNIFSNNRFAKSLRYLLFNEEI